MKQVFRIVFWIGTLIPSVICFGSFFLLSGGEVPGMQFWPFAFAAYASGLVVLPVLLFWWLVYKKTSSSKITFFSALLLILWPLIPLIPIIPSLVQAAKEDHQFNNYANESTLNHIIEIPKLVGQEPIGLQLEISMDLPNLLVDEPSQYMPKPLCSQPTIREAAFRANFVGGEDSGGGRNVNTLEPLKFGLSCTASSKDKMTTVQVTGQVYPAGTRYVQDDLSKICMEIHRENYNQEWSDTLTEFDWEFFITTNELWFTKIENKVNANTKLAEQIGRAFNKISSPDFWKKAYKAMTPEYLQSSGYQPCDKHYPGYYEGGHPGGELVCYCK